MLVATRVCPDAHLTKLAELSTCSGASVRPLHIWARGSLGGGSSTTAVLVGGSGLGLGSSPASLGLSSNSQADSVRGDTTLANAERCDFGILQVHRICG